MLTVNVHVTRQCIDEGRQFAIAEWPIEAAIMDAIVPLLPVRRHVIVVGSRFAIIGPYGGLASGELPTEATRFIAEFEAGRVGEPFSFWLPLDIAGINEYRICNAGLPALAEDPT